MEKARYIHRSDTMQPVNSFRLGDRILCLYYVTGRTPSCAYSLYWDDERLGDQCPIQHAMSDLEVFWVLHRLLEEDWEARHSAEQDKIHRSEYL